MSSAALTVDVYVAPMRPFHGPPAQAPGDEPMRSPMSSTPIAGAEEGILVDTDERSREARIASLDEVAALKPRIVVAGHKRVGAPDGPESIGASQQYLRDFSRIVGEGGGAADIVAEC